MSVIVLPTRFEGVPRECDFVSTRFKQPVTPLYLHLHLHSVSAQIVHICYLNLES